MTTDERFDESITNWFEETAPARLPERVLEATFERTRRSRQHAGRPALLSRFHMTGFIPALGGAAVVVMAAAVAINFYANQPSRGGPAPADDPRASFLGTWASTDPDGSAQTMTIRASGDAVVEIVGQDDAASVCSGAPSTTTGTGRIEGTTDLVIATPVLTCDDGSVPSALSGPPLEEQLRDLTFVHDPARDTLTDNFRVVWTRLGSEDPSPEPTMTDSMWPQSSLEEVQQAQELADAGDPRYAWQVDPDLRDWHSAPSLEESVGDAEIVARFLREELGWEAFRYNPIPEDGFGDGLHSNAAYIRCAPGRTNPLYPNDPERCAPTIDDVRYERVSLDLAQLVRRDASGIWVVTRWATLAPFEQVVPPTEAERTELLEAFLRARIDGAGAETYVAVPDDESPTGEVPLLYATTTGAPYERSQFEPVGGPEWPDGSMQFKIRLFAQGGTTMVEQLFVMNRDEAGRLGLHYRYNPDTAPTTENGQVVPVEYTFLDGAVTFQAAYPWEYHAPSDEPSSTGGTLGLDNNGSERIAVVADPLPVETGCQQGAAPADAEALARSIGSDPDLEATDPVAISIGGIEALRMDVVTAPGASVCDESGVPRVVATETGVAPDERMRLYLLDVPGAPQRILAIAIIAPEPNFERELDAARIVDSFEFHGP